MRKEAKPANPAALAAMAGGTFLALGFTVYSAMGGNLFGKPALVPDPVPAPAPTAAANPAPNPAPAQSANGGSKATADETAPAGREGNGAAAEFAALAANPFSEVSPSAVKPAPAPASAANGAPAAAPNLAPATETTGPFVPPIPKLPELPVVVGDGTGLLPPAPVASPGVPELVGTMEGGAKPSAVLRVDGRTEVVVEGRSLGPWKVRKVRPGDVLLSLGERTIRLAKERKPESNQGVGPSSEPSGKPGTRSMVPMPSTTGLRAKPGSASVATSVPTVPAAVSAREVSARTQPRVSDSRLANSVAQLGLAMTYAEDTVPTASSASSTIAANGREIAVPTRRATPSAVVSTRGIVSGGVVRPEISGQVARSRPAAPGAALAVLPTIASTEGAAIRIEESASGTPRTMANGSVRAVSPARASAPLRAVGAPRIDSDAVPGAFAWNIARALKPSGTLAGMPVGTTLEAVGGAVETAASVATVSGAPTVEVRGSEPSSAMPTAAGVAATTVAGAQPVVGMPVPSVAAAAGALGSGAAPSGTALAAMPTSLAGNGELHPVAPILSGMAMPSPTATRAPGTVAEAGWSASVSAGTPAPALTANPAVGARTLNTPAPRRNRVVGLIQWADAASGSPVPAKPKLPTRTVRFHDKPVEGARIADAPAKPDLPRRRVIFFDPVDPTQAPDRIREATKDAAARKTAGAPTTPAPMPAKPDAKPKDGKSDGDGA
ncbi:MAG: hypothetical protein ACKO5K_17345 [Armatimonadota bacterium]